jgi:CYTH domain-containing protein
MDIDLQGVTSNDQAFERRFLVKDESAALKDAISEQVIVQAYLFSVDGYVARIRRTTFVNDPRKEDATLTLKRPRIGSLRKEISIDRLDPAFAGEFLQLSTQKNVKHRFEVRRDGIVWEIDVFEGPCEGLVIAECKDQFVDDSDLPDWLGPEVTRDQRYFNEELARVPIYKADDGLLVRRQRVFLVHGHSRVAEVRDIVNRVTNAQIEILSERPDKGATVIEKLENAMAGSGVYVLVLLTADDVGRDKRKSADVGDHYRARQNVVFEHGMAIGRFGRPNVCALVEEGVERETDIEGIVYVDLDAPDLAQQIAKNLKQVGFDVNPGFAD